MACLCGSGENYGDCCSLLHTGQRQALTAKELMRSRFTAYAMGNEKYLIDTWDQTKLPKSVNISGNEVVWTRLDIITVKKGGIKDKKGLVEFKAFYHLNGEEHAMLEASRFRKVDNRWLYLDGAVKSINKVGKQTNFGKNAPCSCGSGKKYKRCCGKS